MPTQPAIALIELACVLATGALVGASELVVRYRDAPLKVVWLREARLHLFVNAMVAAAALALAHLLGWRFGVATEATKAELSTTRVLVCGFGAMTLFRAGFSFRFGGSEVKVGLSGVIEALLAAIDREIDRAWAESRADAAAKAMEGVAFAKASVALAPFCFALMQRVTDEEQKRIADQARELAEAEMPDRLRNLLLGLALLNIVGPQVLRLAVDKLGSDIRPQS